MTQYGIGETIKAVPAKWKDIRKATEKTRKETKKGGEHLDRTPYKGDKLKHI